MLSILRMISMRPLEIVSSVSKNLFEFDNTNTGNILEYVSTADEPIRQSAWISI